MKHCLAIGSALFAMAMVQPASAQAPVTPSAQNPVREIARIAGEVYRFRNNNHYSIFAVTSAGIIATDPINAAAADLAQGRVEEALAGQADQVRGL